PIGLRRTIAMPARKSRKPGSHGKQSLSQDLRTSCSLRRTRDRVARYVVGDRIKMKVGAATAAILKREGIEILTGYPVNHLIEFAAAVDIRPIIVRQERIGLHMADAISRMTSGRKLG